MLQRTGAWIFVSHSLRDFAKVRLVRNALEDRGHFPLLFYLRCLHDDAEVDGLIRREIEARSFFLLCESPNAQASKWVQSEVGIIESRPRRLVARLDLESPWNEQLAVIDQVASKVNVFLSYLRMDTPLADTLAAELEKADYSLLGATLDIQPGEDFAQRIRSDIDEAIQTGFVVVLLSPDSVAREESFQWYETRYALERSQQLEATRPRVIPVVLSGSSETISRLPADLQRLQVLDVSNAAPEAQVGLIVQALDQLVLRADV